MQAACPVFFVFVFEGWCFAVFNSFFVLCFSLECCCFIAACAPTKSDAYVRVAGGAPQSRAHLSDVTIVVSSCDKYKTLWPGFFACLFRFWPSLQTSNQHVPIVLITGSEKFVHPRVRTFQTGVDRGWGVNLKKALSTIKTRYVLYLQEDYLLCALTDDAFLANILEVMQANPHVVHCQLAADHVWFRKGQPFVEKASFEGADFLNHSLSERMLKKSLRARYRTSLQAALWRKDALYRLIVDDETPWQFEKKGSKRASALEHEKG